ncbi:hypothetical protein Vadar_029458 [Vaccinium darrowii]|uniref:Uncharacterized protein n=1 Tax=Vaccinium darrowii TaxID=229202 RepID=A0ACB7ZNQ1_9ERIC|nr:hypothetical protein Vadar_029458 [Vaccinium darrowii]
MALLFRMLSDGYVDDGVGLLNHINDVPLHRFIGMALGCEASLQVFYFLLFSLLEYGEVIGSRINGEPGTSLRQVSQCSYYLKEHTNLVPLGGRGYMDSWFANQPRVDGGSLLEESQRVGRESQHSNLFF